MLIYPTINPVAFHLGPVAVHWYGLMYLIGFLGAWGLLSWRIRYSPRGFSQEQLSDIIFYGALGVIIGGRVGYVLFYDWQTFLVNPLTLFKIWQGGMSFHGGFLGVLGAMWIYSLKTGKALGDLLDFIAPVVPIGLGAGRIGNFINGELIGRVTDVPWGMLFPTVEMPRHPSQLYEFMLEGIVLFLILWIYSNKPRPRYAVSGWFSLLYGVFRFSVEFFREPDAQIGYFFGWMTQGQLLSLPMILLGMILLFFAYRGKTACNSI